jgi:cytochrome P450
VAEYDPFAPEMMADPLPFYRELRDRGAVHPLRQYDAWVLPRFEDVWQVLADRDRFSIVEGPIFARDRLLTPNGGAPETSVPRPLPSFSMIDPPVHTRLRRAMLTPFLPNTVATMEADVRAHARAVLDALLARGTFDAVADLGSPVAAVATCCLLGLPVSDHDTIVRQVNAFTRRAPGESGVSPEGRTMQTALHAYLSDFARDSRGRGELVDVLAAYDTGAGEPLSDAEIAVQLTTLLVGGVETLPKIVAGGLHRLWRHPEQRAVLVGDPSLVGNGFEEIMRLESVLQWVGRTLLVDANLGGQPVRAGQRVFLLLVSANHDDREFENPEVFDVRRPFPRTLVFGHGVHYCIGVHAARLEGRVILEELLARMPDYAIDERGIERPPSEFQIGYTAMPVMC